MQKITPFLWFDNQAEEAMNFYVSIFKNSKVGTISRYGDAGPGADGQRDGRLVRAGRHAVHGAERRAAFQVHRSDLALCELRDARTRSTISGTSSPRAAAQPSAMRLAEGQVRPVLADRSRPRCPDCSSDPDRDKANRVMQAMLQMQKIDVAKLEAAAKG